jgi:hypothetical protein
MRISEWAKQWGVTVDRVQANAGDNVYRIKDIFTTRDGSWEPSDKPGSVPQWARNDYLKPMNHPNYNEDGGADHHLFGLVLERDGSHKTYGAIHYYTYTDDGNHVSVNVKKSGWGNQVIFASFAPKRGERGPWAWYPTGLKADVVKGGGMPDNQHVSTFCVWQVEKDDGGVVVITDPPDETDLAAEVAALKGKVAEHDVLIRRMVTLLDSWQGDGK